VQQIIAGSPASAAGLHEGDIISAVEGQPAANLTLEQVRQLFKHKGRSYRLHIERARQTLQTKIKLKRLI
jgi:C-terminal processing protease CtpA/Prc